MNLFKSKINESAESLIKLQEEFDALNTQFSEASESLISITELSNTYKNEFERVDAENKELKEQLAGLTQEIAEVSKDAVLTDELVSMKAVELIADVGHKQVEILEDDESEQLISNVDKFKTLKGKELQEFFNANKAEIFKSLKK